MATVSEDDAEAVMTLERKLTDWMKEQPVSVEWSIMALGISAARLIFGVGALQGPKAGTDAARLLRTSVEKAMGVFERQTPPETRH